jgi:hypothetical protein
VKVGDLINWLDPWKTKRLGLIVMSLNLSRDGYYDVLVDGKIFFCHKSNMEVISESR